MGNAFACRFGIQGFEFVLMILENDEVFQITF